MIELFKRKRASSVLGLSLDGNRLEVVSLRRNNGTLHVRQSLAVPLALSLLNDAAELVGQEIRNHLDKAGIRERRCVFCLPLNWILTMQTQVPEMSEADRESFLQIEAERGFHSGSEALLQAHSIFKTPSGGQFATLLAAPRDQLETLQRVLRAAKLKPLAFSVGAIAMQPADADAGRVVMLAVRSNTVDLQVTAGGGIAALRSLDGVIETQGAQKSISADLVAREIRITLGQLPGGLADAPGKLKVFGNSELARQLVNDLTSRVAPMGLKLEPVGQSSSANFDQPLPQETACSTALALAANYVRGTDTKPDFLPPKVQPWKQLVATRLSPRKLAWAGAAAGGLALCVVGAFGFQQWQINSLESQWKAMESQVNELNADQDQIVKFQPWYNKSFQNIVANLIAAFPQDGSVASKVIELRDQTNVICSGNARDNDSFLKLHATLAGYTNEITGLHAEVRGQKPMQFTLNYEWQGGIANGN